MAENQDNATDAYNLTGRQSERIAELEKLLKKANRENSRLQKAVEQEKIYANAHANQAAARTLSQRSRDRYLQLLLSNSPNIILFLDGNKRVVFCTDTLLRLLAHDGGSFGGLRLREIFEPFCEEEFLGKLTENLDCVMRGEVSPGITGDIAPRVGGSRKYAVSYTPMTGDGGDNEGAMLLFHDVTEIEAARSDAERASLVKSQFLSNMSHEIRTPMNAIIGMTKLAKDSADTERKNYCLSKIEDASAHLLGVINDILDMSKIEAGKLELSPVDFDFEKMLQRVVNVINFKVDERAQNFSVNIDRAIPPVLVGDDQRLAQVITNLLGNAVKFTPEYGSISLDTRFISEEDGVCTIQIRVTDTGIGISPEQQARLFTSFQQAESDTSRKFGGTGLGLAISRNIVEMMGGRIWIESELGSGSTFAFNIQARRGSVERRSLLNPGANWQSIRLLAVDDDPYTREYFKDLAERLGLYCDTAAGGMEALALIAETGSYDIYFLDWRMPEMDGIELARRIKSGGGNDCVITMISATEWGVIEDEARRAGVDKYLSKPLFPSAIADLVNECLGDAFQQGDSEGPKTDDFAGHTILLAEDVDINREIVLALLEPTQIVIDCAVNGAEAVSMFREAPDKYDVIFMDVQMPQMDGYEATRGIRALDCAKAKDIPIIAMTANVFREDIERCLESGMNDHLGKPLDFDEVLEKLRRYLPAGIANSAQAAN